MNPVRAIARAALLPAILFAGACIVEPVEGPWRAWLDSPGGELPFGLELEHTGDGYRGWVINGEERIQVPDVGFDGDAFVLSFPHYDARVVARPSRRGRQLDGEWTRTGLGGTPSRLAFHATAGAAPRFRPLGDRAPGGSVDGRWQVTFDSDEQPAVGVFRQSADGGVEGTFLTATGDYRFLAGDLAGTTLRLSVFDGAHAFLFLGNVEDDGTLRGDFWSRDTWHETWTARRDTTAGLSDAFARTVWSEEMRLADFRYPDLDGRVRALDDPAFHGRVRIIELFGSWCPNCNDAAAYLRELDGRYRDRGLSILGLAFEMTGDFERDARQVATYREHHGIEFPVLLAGEADKAKASEAFSLVDRVRAYPTFLFVDHRGNVRAVYSGFQGPATGEAFADLRVQFESVIEALLAEAPA